MRIFNSHSSIIGRITALVNTPQVKKCPSKASRPPFFQMPLALHG